MFLRCVCFEKRHCLLKERYFAQKAEWKPKKKHTMRHLPVRSPMFLDAGAAMMMSQKESQLLLKMVGGYLIK